ARRVGPAEVIVDHHVAAAEGNREPQGGRDAAVGGGVLRVRGGGLAERGERQVVLQVVDVASGLRAQRLRRRVAVRGRGQGRDQGGSERWGGAPPGFHRS